MIVLALFWVVGIVFILWSLNSMTGQSLLTSPVKIILTLVAAALVSLVLIILASPLIRRLPKNIRNVIDDDFTEKGKLDDQPLLLGLVEVQDQKLRVLADGTLPTMLAEDSLNSDTKLSELCKRYELALEDVQFIGEYTASMPEYEDRVIASKMFRVMVNQAQIRNSKLISSADLAVLQPLEKQVVADLHKSGVIV
jgi:hypothetical protein